MSLLEAEGATADEDEDTQADQNDREQHMLPAFENLRDGRTGGHELRQQDRIHPLWEPLLSGIDALPLDRVIPPGSSPPSPGWISDKEGGARDFAKLGPAFSRIFPCYLSYLTVDHGPTGVTLVNGSEHGKHVVESASHVGLQEVFLV